MVNVDINIPVDPKEMVIDPPFAGPVQQEMFLELNDFLNQVSEDEDDADLDPTPNAEFNDPLVIAVEPVEVNIPVLDGPAQNVFPLEI